MEEKIYVLKCEVEVTARNETEAETIGLEDINQLSNEGTLAWDVFEKEEPTFIIVIKDPVCKKAVLHIPKESGTTEYVDIHNATLLMGTYQASSKEQAIKDAAEKLNLPESILHAYAEVK